MIEYNKVEILVKNDQLQQITRLIK